MPRINEKLLNELLKILQDTHHENNPNLTFRGFICGNYNKDAREQWFPETLKFLKMEISNEKEQTAL